jgi:hypothetical protein
MSDAVAPESPRPATPVAPHVREAPSLRARDCPWAIGVTWAWRTALAMFVAGPAAALVRQAYPHPPRGDAVLWEPGGHALLAFAIGSRHALTALLWEAAMVLVVGAVIGLVPTAAVMVGIAQGRRSSLGHASAVAIRRLPALVRLALGVTAAQSAIVGIALLLGRIATAVAWDALGEARAEMAGAAIALPFLPIVLGLSVTHDLARANVVRWRAGATGAFFAAIDAWRKAPWAIAWGWTWRASLGAAPVFAAAALATRIGAQGGALSILALAVAHQSTIAVRAALHVSWLARALRAARA